MEICNSKGCTGCFACYNICIKGAITVVADNEGFYKPVVNNELCSNCGKCIKVCPVNTAIFEENKYERKSYACWSKNDFLRKESSSGGLFSELSKSVIKGGGMIYGASFTSDFVVRHSCVLSVNMLNELRGSKYVQSFIGNTYTEILRSLKESRLVLFVGTPCQVAGLKSFLGSYWKNLITLDFICHGVPSPLAFLKYKTWLEKKHKSKMVSFKFRDKRKSWLWFNIKANFETGFSYYGSWFKDPYLRAFLRNYTLMSSCYQCKYSTPERQSDITIADYWGLKSSNKKEKNTDEGISLTILNTKKGMELFNTAKNNLIFFEHPLEEVLKSQKSLSSSWPEPINRAEFWADFLTKDFETNINEWMYPEKRNFAQYLRSSFGKNSITDILIFVFNKYSGLRFKIVSFLGLKTKK
jgi:coenzyme F420-reducing hydrogenase beta subunit